MRSGFTLVNLAFEDAVGVVRVFVESFYDYPVMRYVLGDARDYADRLEKLVGLFVMARALREEPMIGISRGSELCAALTASDPDNPAAPPAFTALREQTWQSLDDESRQRYDRCVAAWQPLAVQVPQLHVNMIGVRPAFQGRGFARQLLERVHDLSQASPRSTGVTLTTEVPANVRFYQHLGYQVVAHTRITEELESWGLFRPDARPTSASSGSIAVT